jgi:ubiquinone/menaquinone biosynthesis C-methylase UbiE
MDKSGIVRKGYSKIAIKYGKWRTGLRNAPMLEEFSARVAKGAKVIDLGCGTGVPVAKFLEKKGFEVTGIDFSEGMLALARENVPNARFVEMDLRRLRFRENSFRGAVSFYAMIHIPRREHAGIYRKLHRIIKPGGLLLANACGPDAWEKTVKDYFGVEMFWSFYGPRRTLKIIETAGFVPIWGKVKTIGGERQFWVLASNRK